jgi:urea transport system permease protein
VNYAKTSFSTALPSAWLYFLGALFVLTTLFLPHGFIGLGRARRERKRAAGGAAATSA